ncbi:protoporphyrinogen oxidase [Streptomyces sp. QHH-9511]|uniref:protoporphyrinogen oxidase n=1 Tax=Streptomyces sp. QHH-9511 TaxID=2684468 RepID=UPI001316210D|nr:protoporphyrinogen oxidase [Streptomyces sp. QHH-9511]QGZ51518.1 protoporphyrinogen oxidase [Streptomyces sp. QHH-9511]
MNADTTGASGQASRRTPATPAHVVVVGGGIAGLATAHRLTSAGVRVTLLEGGGRLGGKLLAGEIAGAPVDLGAESLLARRPEAVALAGAVGLGDRLQAPATTTASVWSRGTLIPMPKGHVMGVPADGGAVGGLLSDQGVRRVGQDRELPPTEIGDDIAIGAYVADRMGHEVVDRLVEPLLGGVYAGDAYRISMRAAVPKLFEAARVHPTLTAAVRAVQQAGAATPADAAGAATGLGGSAFMGIEGGIGTLPGAVADAIRAAGGEILTHAPVTGLRRVASPDGPGAAAATRTRWQVVTPGRTLLADGVVVATPAWSAAELLAEEVPAASAELGAVEYASMALVTLAFRRSDIQELPGSGFLVPPVDGHTIKASTFSSQKWRWVTDAAPDLFVLRTSVGRYGEEEQVHRDDADLVEVSLKDFGAATGLTARPVATTVTRWIDGLPQYPVGHLARVARLRAAVAAVPGLRLAGAVYDGVGIPACVASAHRAADEIAKEIADEIIATSKTVDPGAGHCP